MAAGANLFYDDGRWCRMEIVEFIVTSAVFAVAFGIWELGFRRDRDKRTNCLG